MGSDIGLFLEFIIMLALSWFVLAIFRELIKKVNKTKKESGDNELESKSTPQFSWGEQPLPYLVSSFFGIYISVCLSKNIDYPFKKQVQITKRSEELNTFAASTHFALGHLLSSIILPPLLFLGCLCLFTFADSLTSMIGMRFGGTLFSRKLNWNNKTIEGCLAGIFFGFISMVWFVGWIYALVGAITFLITDLLTPNPIRMSDNIFVPLLCTLAFVLLSIAGGPYTNYLGIG